MSFSGIYTPKEENNLDVRKLQTGIYYYNVLEGEVVKLKGKLVKE